MPKPHKVTPLTYEEKKRRDRLRGEMSVVAETPITKVIRERPFFFLSLLYLLSHHSGDPRARGADA